MFIRAAARQKCGSLVQRKFGLAKSLMYENCRLKSKHTYLRNYKIKIANTETKQTCKVFSDSGIRWAPHPTYLFEKCSFFWDICLKNAHISFHPLFLALCYFIQRAPTIIIKTTSTNNYQNRLSFWDFECDIDI